jgi:hypothetical protein
MREKNSSCVAMAFLLLMPTKVNSDFFKYSRIQQASLNLSITLMNLDAILAASKKGASFIVTTLAWEPVCLDKSLEGKPAVIDEKLDPAIRIMEEEYHKISKIMKNLDNYNYGMTAEEKETEPELSQQQPKTHAGQTQNRSWDSSCQAGCD